MEPLMRSKLHLAMAVGLYMQGDTAGAEKYLGEVKFMKDTIPDLGNCLMDRLMNDFVINPIEMIHKLRSWSKLRKGLTGKIFRQLLAAVCVKEAFKAYSNGQRYQLWRLAIRGIINNPKNIRNRGLLSIMVKALIGKKEPRAAISNPKDQYSMTKELTAKLTEHFNASTYSLEPVKGGTSGTPIYRINLDSKTYALRLLDSKVAETRKAVIEAALKLGIKAPAPTTFPVGKDNPDLYFWLDEWVAGQWFIPDKLGPISTEVTLRELASFLRSLHSIPLKGYGFIKAPTLETTDASFDKWMSQNHLRALGSLFNARLSKKYFSLFMAADQYLSIVSPNHICLNHGQLAHPNLLFNDGHLVAIIDWEEALGCDPAYDIAVFLKNMVFYEGPENENLYSDILLSSYQPENIKEFQTRVNAFRIMMFAWEANWIPDVFGKEKMELFETALLKKQIN
jgi:aminoglycoside phosphotransferase (APT) family kinase protein